MAKRQGYFKRKWKHWIQEDMFQGKKNLDSTYARNGNNFRERLSKQNEVTEREGEVFFHV